MEEPVNDGVNVTLTWTESLHPTLYFYLGNITPETLYYVFTDMDITIEIVSNRIYSVSISAAPVCGPMDQITSPIMHTGLFYREQLDILTAVQTNMQKLQ